VVEDEEALARLAAQILGSLGYRVVVAGDYETAIRAAQSLDSLDLLISDVVLPGPSGVEVAAAIAELHPGVEVLYTSGYTNDAVVRHGVQAGSVALLQKPYTREALAVRVRRLLDGVDDVGSSRP
jgi:CheY-like chemotaxis protein